MCNKSRLESLFLERKLEIIYLISSQFRFLNSDEILTEGRKATLYISVRN